MGPKFSLATFEEAEGEPDSEVDVGRKALEAELELEGEELPEHGHVVVSCAGQFGVAGEVQEVDVFEAGVDADGSPRRDWSRRRRGPRAGRRSR